MCYTGACELHMLGSHVSADEYCLPWAELECLVSVVGGGDGGGGAPCNANQVASTTEWLAKSARVVLYDTLAVCRTMAGGDSWRKRGVDGMDAVLEPQRGGMLGAHSPVAQHTSTPSQVLLCPALLCVLCPALLCVLCCAVPCPAVLFRAVPCYVLLWSAMSMLHRTCPVRWCAVQIYMLLHLSCAGLCCTFAWLCCAALYSDSWYAFNKLALSVCRGLRPLATAQGQHSVSSDLRCMALAGWSQGTGQEGAPQEGPLQAHIVAASSDATMSLLHFDVHACRSAYMLTHVNMLLVYGFLFCSYTCYCKPG